MIEFEKIKFPRARREFHRLGIGQNETEWATEPGRSRIIDAINNHGLADDSTRLKFFKSRELDALGLESGISPKVNLFPGMDQDRTPEFRPPGPVFNVFAAVDD